MSNTLIGLVHFVQQTSKTTCGQACVAMLTGETVEQVCARLGHADGTTLDEVTRLLSNHPRTYVHAPRPLALTESFHGLGLAFLNYPTIGHWVVWVGDAYLDPCLGELEPGPAWERWALDGAQPTYLLPVEVLS